MSRSNVGELCLPKPWTDRAEEPFQVPQATSISLAASYSVRWKACGDWLLALAILIVSAPIVLLAAICIKFTSPGPVIYSQVRLGRGGRPFRIYKLRTMRHDCEKHSGARWSTPGDARVTPLGRFLRTTHIDEFPQLWNILRGEMSLVGPRPERPEFIPKLEEALGRYRDRLLVRPGISGLAQIQLPPDTDLDSVRRKLAHDLCYVEQMSWWLDFRILMCTALNLVGISNFLPVGILRLPGGEPVEQAYRESLVPVSRSTPERIGSVGELPRDPLAPELQPA